MFKRYEQSYSMYVLPPVLSGYHVKSNKHIYGYSVKFKPVDACLFLKPELAHNFNCF